MSITYDKFISVILDDAMARVCYETTDNSTFAGWSIIPKAFAVSSTDWLEGMSDTDIFDSNGKVNTNVFNLLKGVTSQQINGDTNIWLDSLPFSGVTKYDDKTLTHHLVVPGNLSETYNGSKIKTIYFLYADEESEEPFVYAMARCTEDIVYEKGIAQTFFFNFTVNNSNTIDLTNFKVHYAYPLQIEQHNEYENAHEDYLLSRDGTRSVTAPLIYENGVEATNAQHLINKGYVDNLVGNVNTTVKDELHADPSLNNQIDTLLQLIQQVVCPPGSMVLWPSKTVPLGWAIRNGQLLSITDNPKLYSMFHQTYKDDWQKLHPGSSYNETQYFPLMNDMGLYFRACEISNGQYNTDLLSGIDFGKIQPCAVPNLKGTLSGHNKADGKLFKVTGASEWHGNKTNNGQKHTITFSASNYNEIYQDVKEVRTVNRNYLPIIRLG